VRCENFITLTIVFQTQTDRATSVATCHILGLCMQYGVIMWELVFAEI